MAHQSTEVRQAAKAAEAAVALAQLKPTPGNIGAAERASNVLHKRLAGHHPGNGRSLDRACRAELRYGKPGEACEKFRAYLRDLAGVEPAAPAPKTKAEAAKGA